MAYLNLDLSKYSMEQERKFSFVPAGIYSSKISGAEVKETKDQAGAYISVVHEIVSGDFKGYCVQDMINIHNNSDRAVEIGMARLLRYRHLLGQDTTKIADSDELIGGALVIEISEDINGENKYSRVKKLVKADDGSTPEQPKQAPATTSAPAQERKLPWKK